MLQSLLPDLFNGFMAIALGIARIFPCLLITPIFSFSTLRGMIRNAIVVSLSLFISPVIAHQISGQMLSSWAIVAIAMKETILGLLLGYLLALPFWLFESVGALFDSQRGALNAGQLNPALGPDATPLGDILLRWSMVFLVMSFGLSLVTQVIWDSYGLWPVNQLLPDITEAGFKQFLIQVHALFVDMVRYAGPLVLLLLFIDFGVGIISIYSPQLQANVLAIPLKCLVGVGFFVLYIPVLEHFAGIRFESLHDLIPHLHDVFDDKRQR